MYVKKTTNKNLRSYILEDEVTNGLAYYWPIFNNKTDDLISGANMFGCSNAQFTQDRFGKENSALSLNLGYCQLPPGVYINGSFTITAWVKVKSLCV